MNEQELKQRSKEFALRTMRLAKALPTTAEGHVIRNQLLRSATSVGANYRAACREGQLLPVERVRDLLDEADQLTAILTASRKTAAAKK